MVAKLRNMIVLAVKNTLNKFDLAYPQAQASWLGKAGNLIVVFPYGTRSQAPVGSQMLKFNIMADEANRVAIEFDTDSLPADDMGVGEYECGNFLKGSSIRFMEDGTIKIKAVKNLDIDIEGDVSIKSTGNVSIETAGSASVEAKTVNVKASTATIDANCELGGSGGQGLARQGDTVQVNTETGAGTITSGSGNHTAT